MAQLGLLARLILVMLMEKFLKQKQIFHFADAVTPRRSHFAMAATAKLGLLQSKLVSGLLS